MLYYRSGAEMTKIIQPLDPLIYKVAGEMAAVMYEAGRSSGMTSKHKNARAYAKANLEKFVPLAIKHLIELLKPTSNCTEYMRQQIHAALTNPINDPDLMEKKVDTDLNNEILKLSNRKFEKNKITVLHN